ncbi:DUF6276 family protein [Halorussus amylolyticus]|uniref:DUF6276 family protein n=1 Tax=Halorussus amylolyticus TaxID=1126242 RepID=UPI001042CF78|nr:DUF6276 family protein [Halorussus amylolyticus]
MACPRCGGDRLAFAVPTDLRAYLPDETDAVTICTRCLALEPADDAPGDRPDFTEISHSFPTGETGAAMALAVGLLDSLALYRSEISALLERVERGGSDPLLVIDRLAADPDVEPSFDVDRRRTQVEQLLYE